MSDLKAQRIFYIDSGTIFITWIILLGLQSLRHRMSVSVPIFMPFLFLTHFPSSILYDNAAELPVYFRPVLVLL